MQREAALARAKLNSLNWPKPELRHPSKKVVPLGRILPSKLAKDSRHAKQSAAQQNDRARLRYHRTLGDADIVDGEVISAKLVHRTENDLGDVRTRQIAHAEERRRAVHLRIGHAVDGKVECINTAHENVDRAGVGADEIGYTNREIWWDSCITIICS